MKIVVSGYPGSGSSTLCLLLSYSLGMRLLKGSESFRLIAKFMGARDNHEETALIETKIQPYWGPIYDKYIKSIIEDDKSFDCVIDSDIAGFLVEPKKGLYRIFLVSSTEKRQKNFSSDSRPASPDLIREIDNKLQREYLHLHNFDFLDLEFVRSTYDFILDNTNIGIAEELVVVGDYLARSVEIDRQLLEKMKVESKLLEEEFWKSGKRWFIERLVERLLLVSGVDVIKDTIRRFRDDVNGLETSVLKAVAEIADK